MRLMAATFAFALALAEEGCPTPAPESAGGLQYIRDPRTDLCFAYETHGFGNGIYAYFSAVPCTEKVLALVPQEQRPR